VNGTLALGWRNIWRNRRRTLISMSATGVGLILVIFYSGLVGGMLGQAKTQLDMGGLGHVEVYAKGFRPRRPLAAVMPPSSEWKGKLELPHDAEVGERVLARGLATSARGNEPVQLFGVDFAAERFLSAHVRAVKQGALPEAADTRGVLVGDVLAERLGLKVGSKLRVMVQRADGDVGADLFRVRGIFHSVAANIGKRQVLMTADAARELLGLSGGAHQLVVQLSDPDSADAVAAKLQAALGDGFEVSSWSQNFPVMRRMEGLTNNVVFALGFFVYLLVGLGVLNTMLMSVLERTRELGVLMSLGTRPSGIVRLVLAESFWIATLSVVAGVAIGGALNFYYSQEALQLFQGAGESFELDGMYLSTAFKTRFSVGDILKASSFVFAMALFVGLYPARRITRLQPAEALRRT
jgi:ABC-type lipoprotein release transport system permease subunit